MKFFLFLAICVVVIVDADAQKFVVTPGGVRSTNDTLLDYIAIPLDSSAHFLYSRAYSYVQKTFKNPDKVLKGNVANEYLRIDTYEPYVFDFHYRKHKFPMSVEYSVELEFTANRIKYRLFDVRLESGGYPLVWTKIRYPLHGVTKMHIYDTDGSLEHPNEKKAIEDYFEGRLNEFIRFINQPAF